MWQGEIDLVGQVQVVLVGGVFFYDGVVYVFDVEFQCVQLVWDYEWYCVGVVVVQVILVVVDVGVEVGIDYWQWCGIQWFVVFDGCGVGVYEYYVLVVYVLYVFVIVGVVIYQFEVWCLGVVVVVQQFVGKCVFVWVVVQYQLCWFLCIVEQLV